MTGLDRLFDIILSMQKDITDIKEKTAVNTANLQTHMKRTDQNEELIHLSQSQTNLLKERIEKLENRDQLMSTLWKISVSLAGFVVSVLSIIIAIRQLH